MIIACIVLSSLALLAAGANLILFFVEKKRDTARRQAMLDYVNNQCECTIEENETFVKEYVDKNLEKVGARIEQQQSDIEKLKNGVCPNYEAALAAANAVNDFNAGISAIMNFDPLEAARKRRRVGEEEVS